MIDNIIERPEGIKIASLFHFGHHRRVVCVARCVRQELRVDGVGIERSPPVSLSKKQANGFDPHHRQSGPDPW